MNLTPDWVVGFVDGEGCFYVGFYAHPEMTAGYQVLPEFRVVQHYRDIKILYALKRFFKCGVVRKNHEDRYEFRVRKIDDLIKIVNFFEKHPLKTSKNVDFKKFAKIIRKMQKGEHLSFEGLKEIIKTSLEMNTRNKPIAEKILKEIKRETG